MTRSNRIRLINGKVSEKDHRQASKLPSVEEKRKGKINCDFGRARWEIDKGGGEKLVTPEWFPRLTLQKRKTDLERVVP